MSLIKDEFLQGTGTDVAHPEAKRLQRFLDRAIESNREHVANVELNLAFLSGNQYTNNSLSHGMNAIENPIGEQWEVDNRMLDTFQFKMDAYFRKQPVITAVGSGNDIMDEERANVASRLADHWRQNNGWIEAEEEAARWVLWGGEAYIAPVWRNKPGQKRKITIEKFNDLPRMDKNGKITFTEKIEIERADGDIAFDVFNSLNTFPFPLYEQRWSKITSVLHADIVTYEYITEHLRLDIKREDLKAIVEGEIRYNSIDSARKFTRGGFNIFGDADSYMNQKQSGPDGKRHSRYLMLQERERPSLDHPEGQYIVTVGGVLISSGPLPYFHEARSIDPNDELNMTMGIIPWWNKGYRGAPSLMNVLRPHQARINRLITDEAQNRMAVGRNKIFYDEEMIDATAFTDEHGEMIPMRTVAGQFNLHIIEAKTLAGISIEIERAEKAYDLAAGQPALFRGQNPPQVRGAFHLDILIEEGMTKTNSEIKLREKFHQNTFKLAFEISRPKYTVKRVIKIFGSDKAYMATTFKSTVQYFDIIVKEGSAIPRNKAAKEAKTFELLKSGAFLQKDGTQDTDLLWDQLEQGSNSRSFKPEQRVRDRAKFENRMMLFGELSDEFNVIPLEWEDHELHIAEHDAFMSSPEFYSANPEIQSLVQTHRDYHEDILIALVAPETRIQPGNDELTGLQDQIVGSTPQPAELGLLPQQGAPAAVPQGA